MYNEMTVTEFKEYVKQPEITDRILEMRSGIAKEKANGKPSFICPICKHGQNGDGLTHIPAAPELLKCFGKCNGKTGDVIQFFQEADGKDFLEEIKTLADLLGITIKTYTPASDSKTFRSEKDHEGNNMNNTVPATPPIKYNEIVDYTPYYTECFTRIQKPGENEKAISYLKSRGISLNTALSYNIGYDPAADPANAPGAKDYQTKKHPAARLIVPCDKGFYAARTIEENIVEKKYWKMNARGSGQKTRHILMPEWIYNADYIFITEGVFDALSIAEAGTAAVALNSVSFAGELIDEFTKRRPAGIVLLALDNDPAGEAATEKIESGLNSLTIPHARANICGEWKDPNQALVKDPAAFIAAVKNAKENATRPNGIAAYLTGEGYDNDTKNVIPPIPTGFNILNHKSGGGIYTGLYVIAAPSSLGKTTFCLQLACNIAETGRDVLYIAMEQSRLELVNKCISRVSIAHETSRTNPSQNAVMATECRNPNEIKMKAINKHRAELAARVKNHLSIIEWNLDATTGNIKRQIEQHINMNPQDAPPVVIIDYLQLIQGETVNGRRQGIKETMDDAASELKKLSREKNIPIIAISSINRANYLMPFAMEAIKESGGIEYTADVVLGMQLAVIDGDEMTPQDFKNFEKVSSRRKAINEAKATEPRKTQIVCVKNRYGSAYFKVNFDYYPRYDYFIESEKQ